MTQGFFEALLILAASHQSAVPDIEELNRLAEARDVPRLDLLLAPRQNFRVSPFRIFRTNGPYDVGNDGWHALPLRSLQNRDLVVFTTRMTSEDTGELVFERTAKGLVYLPERDSFGFRITSHSFDFKFDIPSKKAFLTDTVTVENKDRQPEAFMRFCPQYRVKSITGARGPVAFVQSGGTVAVAAPPLDHFQLQLKYEAVVDAPMFAGSIGAKEATLTNDYWYPMIARQPAPYDMYIHCPSDWTGVAQGELDAVTDEKGGHVFHYVMKLPVVYFSASAGTYSTYTAKVNGREYHVWAANLTEEQKQTQCVLYAGIVEFYEKAFGPFPFSSYGSLVSDVYGGGMLEAYSFATAQSGEMPQEDAHEPSHTWFGGLINNDYFDSLWNESFANFCTGFYERNVAIGNHLERVEAYGKTPNPSPNWTDTTMRHSGVEYGGSSSSIGYDKGSFFLQMLEQLLGTETFTSVVREWVARHPREKTGTWDEFEALANKLTDGKTTRFFTDWLDSKELPVLDISAPIFSNSAVRGTVKFGAKAFDMPLQVMLQMQDGSRKYTMVYLQPDASGEAKIMIPSDSKPALVSFDPWRTALRAINRDERTEGIGDLIFRRTVVFDPAHPEYGGWREMGGARKDLPQDLAGVVVIGHPESLKGMAELCEKAGFDVRGNQLTYDGTTIDLRSGGAAARVDLGEGKHCVILLGHAVVRPDFGNTQVMLFDGVGRMLRGKSDPKTSGWGVFRL